MTTHTPGPWIVSYEREQPIQVEAKIDGNFFPIAIVRNRLPWSPNGSGRVEDNARLIAAAPELLEKSKEFLALWDEERKRNRLPNCCCLGQIPCPICDLRAAIAKAEKGE